MTQVERKHSRPRKLPRSVTSLCREWRQTHLKAAFDVSMLDETDDDGVALLGDIAEATKLELERDIAAGEFVTLDDAQSVLSIALALLRDNPSAIDRAEPMMRAVHRGMNLIRNVIERRAA